MPEGGLVSLAVYDVLGSTVGDLLTGYREAGYHIATWNAANAATGVYFVQLSVSNDLGRVQSTKMNKLILMK